MTTPDHHVPDPAGPLLPDPGTPPPPYPSGHDFAVSLIRTIVPTILGTILAHLAARGFELDGPGVISAVTGLCIVGYYAIVRAIETRRPAAGVLLGTTRQPVYASTTALEAPRAPGTPNR